jgi:hypothetical protein
MTVSVERSKVETLGAASDFIPSSPTKEPLRASQLTASRSGIPKKLPKEAFLSPAACEGSLNLGWPTDGCKIGNANNP